PGTDKAVEQPVIAQHMAHVLAEEAFDALAEFLDPLDVGLRHAPCTVRRIGAAGLELPDARLRPEVPRDVGHEILDRVKRAHRRARYETSRSVLPCWASGLF